MKVLDRLRAEIRVRHYSIRTEHAYVEWVTRFVRFHNMRHPEEMGAGEIRVFLSHLASEANVAASTQNQALCALVFLYQHVLGRNPGDLKGIVRAKRPKRMPVVLSVDETQRVLAGMSGRARLMALLMYGTGMRIIEVIRLRVKDVDFANEVILVRDGKGEKDRYVPLPRTVAEDLRDQLQRVKRLHDQDLRDGYGTVHLPYALERKYPNTNKAFHWQYLFPSPTLSVDPRSGVRQRHHVYESVLQQAIRDAAAKAGLTKDVHSHTFRHSCATHVLASGSDIRTVQELLGHKDVRTTQIYTHVLHMGPQGLISPADRLDLPRKPPSRPPETGARAVGPACDADAEDQVEQSAVEAPPMQPVSSMTPGQPPPARNKSARSTGEPAAALPPGQQRVGVMVFPGPPAAQRAAGLLRRMAGVLIAWAALAVRTLGAWRGGHPCGT